MSLLKDLEVLKKNYSHIRKSQFIASCRKNNIVLSADDTKALEKLTKLVPSDQNAQMKYKTLTINAAIKFGSSLEKE